jgi:hypothetical protein
VASYIYNIPQPTDKLSISQGQILGNFTVLGAIAGNGTASSSSINDNPGQSGFNWIYFANQTSIPPVGSLFTSGSVALYSAPDTFSTQNELYVNKLNKSGIVQVPLSASILGAVATPGSGSQGWTYLPSGVMIMWGTFASGSTSTGNFLVPVPAGFPYFSQIFNVQLSATTNSGMASDPNVAFYLQTYVTTSANLFQFYQVPRSGAMSLAYSNLSWVIIGTPAAY